MSIDQGSRSRGKNSSPLQDAKLWREHAYVDGDWCEGDDAARFDVRNPADGSRLASGVYLYRLELDGRSLTRKMTLLQ